MTGYIPMGIERREGDHRIQVCLVPKQLTGQSLIHPISCTAGSGGQGPGITICTTSNSQKHGVDKLLSPDLSVLQTSPSRGTGLFLCKFLTSTAECTDRYILASLSYPVPIEYGLLRKRKMSLFDQKFFNGI